MKEERQMKTLYFKCTLKTDVIISESSATVGHQTSLDYIPGSNFLGICARHYDELSDEEQLMMFHTGDVQFGDAHAMLKGIRTLRIPASMYYPKLKKVEDECYIHHAHKHEEGEQLKQCRSGFYAFVADEKTIHKAEIEKSYAIKSAYDYESRRSQDSQMYGYESLDEGLELLFEVRVSDKAESLSNKIEECLIGRKNIGRSKTAQYGMVEITKADEKAFPKYDSSQKEKDYNGNEIQIVYAESRLIFINPETLQPSFRPSAKELEFSDGEIDWSLSQVRTFQYAPWNNKRKTYDTDRCGIEKGSVFVVKGATSTPEAKVVGQFKNEGFGKVIYNPSFLEFKDKGMTKWTFVKREKVHNAETKDKYTSGSTPLLKYINKTKRNTKTNEEILRAVNNFVEKYKGRFTSESFKSQWGQIRSIASKYKDTESEKIYIELFGRQAEKNESENEKKIRETENKKAYLNHGVAKDKWDENGRRNKLKEFVDKFNDSRLKKLLINLASQMQKEIEK